ncbi:MAG: SEC-C metal-binding domain-containing protein [Bacteroidota bacterium]
MNVFGVSFEEQVYREFYKKTGIQITDEPILEYDEPLNSELKDLHFKSRSHPRQSIKRLEKLIKLHPNVPSLKNFYYTTLVYTNQEAKAKKVLQDTLVKHPKYIFAISNTILNLNTKEELKEKEHLLGSPKDIRELEGYDKPIHISAFKSYQAAVAHFETIMGNEAEAIARLDTLIDLNVEQEITDQIATKIAFQQIQGMAANIRKNREERVDSESKQTFFLESTTTPPKLNYPQVEVFYETSISTFDKKDIAVIESLKSEILILDLENIIEDSIKRWDVFKESDFDDSHFDFMIHAMYWLGHLKSTNSLDKVLNLLRMGEAFIDYWMSDWFEDYFYPTLYALGENQLDQLKEFVLEDYIYSYHRLIVAKVVAQVAMHQPNRREEVIDWFRSVFDYLLEHQNNTALIDSGFITYLLSEVVDFRGIELLQYFDILNEKGWIESNIRGDINKMKMVIQLPFHASDLSPLPQNIEEYYSQGYKSRKASAPPLADEDKKKMKPLLDPSPGDALVMQKYMEMFSTAFGSDPEPHSNDEDSPFDYYEPYDNDEYSPFDFNNSFERPQTYVRKEKKIGRNDPCPCGSGKKYKKCCL